MNFGDLFNQLGFSTSGNTAQDPNSLAAVQQQQLMQLQQSQQPQYGRGSPPLLNPDHPLTQALMASLSPQGTPPAVGAGVSIPTAAPVETPVDLNNPDNVIQATAHLPPRQKSQPPIPGSQTPTGGPIIPTGVPQDGVATPGVATNPNALFGLVHGTPAKVLNNFVDAFYTGRGLQPPNYDKVLLQQEANALQGFTDHPMEAIQRLAQVDPQGAQGMYMKQLEAARVGQAATDAHATANNALQNNVLGAAGRLLSNSTPDNYADHYKLAQGIAGRNGFTLDNLAVPAPEDVAAGKGVVKNADGTTAWDPDTQRTLSTASNYGTPAYRVENSQSSATAANARATLAKVAESTAPSLIALRQAQAGALGKNASTAALRAGIDADYKSGLLDNDLYTEGLRQLGILSANPQLAGKIPPPPTPHTIRGASGGAAPPQQSSDPVVASGKSKSTGQTFYKHRSGAISSTP